MKHLTDQELTALLTYCEHTTDPTVLVIELLARTGMRSEELTRLRKQDFVAAWEHDASFAAVYIHGAKNSKSAWCPIPHSLYRRINSEVLSTLDKVDDYFWSFFTINPHSKHTKRNIRRYWYKVRDYLFKDKGAYGIHSLRHTFALRIFRDSQNNIIQTQKALRHKAINSTARYLDYIQSKEIGAAIIGAIK